MHINRLIIHNFRNILNVEYSFKHKVSIFYGNNGVGKTSILEAIHFVSSGKSFRKSKSKSLIASNQDHFTVFLSLYTDNNSHSISVKKSNNGRWTSKINSSLNSKQSTITSLLPVISLDPDIYRLIDHGPSFRRNYLDWIVFHVKHDYLLLWKKVNKCIKQLNYLYKKKKTDETIALWEESFVLFSNQLNSIREHFFKQIEPIIYKLNHFMQEEVVNFKLVFKRGWSEGVSLQEQLRDDRERNLKFGQLHSGPHKMEISINIKGVPAAEILSRGQKKILSLTFYMAHIELLKNNSIDPIICLDDFDAEIDKHKLFKAADFFKKTQSQIFITSVDKNKINKVFPEAELFHVKHE